ncbi:putative plasmid maintenance protein [Escherichia coli]|nr:putative plasmid maintenance protein [Escherichia coli]
MANHPRPGDIIQESLDELNVSLREFARAMEIAPSTASRLLTGKAALTPEMAIKLSVVIGSSPQMWLNQQNAWSLAEAEKNSGCVAITPSGYAIKKWHFIKRHLELMTNATLPDALRLSGLHVHCNLLDLKGFHAG